jgi:glutamate racemase
MSEAPIGIFDSGIGGVTTLDACRRLLFNEDFIYIADERFAPYGDKPEEFIVGRVFACARRLADMGAKAVVIACNTATNAGAGRLRTAFPLPVVGLEPAVKPAYEAYTGGRAVLPCTPATAASAKFRTLLSRFGGYNLTVLPLARLAGLIEKNIENPDVLEPYIREIFSPYPDLSQIILGCTHYVFLRGMLERIFGGRVKIFDGNDGAAKRLKLLLQARNLLSPRPSVGRVEFLT